MTAHLAEHDLVRLLDEELGGGNAALAAHLDLCAACTERRDVLERRSMRLREALAAADPAPRVLALHPDALVRPTVRRPAYAWRAAAAFAVLLVGSLAVPPVRAWIAQRAGAIMDLASGRHRPTAAAPVRAPVPPDTAGRLTFAPVGPQLVLEVASRQAAGVLVVETVADTAISALVVGEREAAELTVLPGGLRVRNTRASTASYLVAVPLLLEEVAVRIGREEPVFLRPSRPGERWDIRLRARESP
jgi:hypothetical protein